MTVLMFINGLDRHHRRQPDIPYEKTISGRVETAVAEIYNRIASLFKREPTQDVSVELEQPEESMAPYRALSGE